MEVLGKLVYNLLCNKINLVNHIYKLQTCLNFRATKILTNE